MNCAVVEISLFRSWNTKLFSIEKMQEKKMKKSIWAPWRIEYILGEKSTGCFLCNMFSEEKDRENLILKRGKTCAVLMNRYP